MYLFLHPFSPSPDVLVITISALPFYLLHPHNFTNLFIAYLVFQGLATEQRNIFISVSLMFRSTSVLLA